MHLELFSALAEWDAAISATHAFLEEVPACLTTGWRTTPDETARRGTQIGTRLHAANQRLSEAVIAHATVDEHIEIMLECAKEMVGLKEHRALFDLLFSPDPES